MNPLTQQGIVALKAGNKAEARRCLKLALQQDEKDISAWLWLSGAVENERERLYCLKTVLRLDPQNELAQRGLAAVSAKQPASQPPAPNKDASSTATQPPAPSKDASPTASQPPAPRQDASQTVSQPPAPKPAAASMNSELPVWQPPASLADPQPPANAEDQPFTFASILNQESFKPAPPPAPAAPPAFVPLFADLPTWASVDDAESAADQALPMQPEIIWPADSSTSEPAESGASWMQDTPSPAVQSTGVEKAEAAPARSTSAKPANRAAAPAASKKPAQKQPAGAFKPWMWIALGGMALLLVCVVVGIIAMISTPANGQPAVVAGVQATVDLRQAATDFPTPTPSFTPTPRPTRTPTATATFMVLGPTIVGQMADIQREVSDLRGLPLPDTEVPSYVVTRVEAENLLRGLYINDETLRELENTRRTLVILGLIKPTYDLVNLSLNHIVDNIGGFYLPDSKRIFVLATYRFGGIEHWIYSHEFDHAVVDKAYDISKMQECPGDDQRCAAMDALIEGDASLLMRQWVMQYATPQNYKDFLAYHPPALALPEEFPPDFLVKDSNFPYEQGLAFVSALYERGNWAEVNRAYANPPSSTEQILHPEKYLAGEGPALMSAPPVDIVLGSDWQMIVDNSLGEWNTYLLLGYGADKAAQIEDAAAQKAAAGWGGDHYQVYYNAGLDQTALVAHWTWDSDADGQQFDAAMQKLLNERFRGNTLDQPGASCWQMNNQTTCLVSRPGQTLWLSASDLQTLNLIWSQYPEFK